MDLRACCKRGPHAKDDCGFPQNHPNYEFCALHQPPYLWAVAPDADVCLRLTYEESQVALEQFHFDSSNFKGDMLADMRKGTLTVVSGDITHATPGAMKIKTPTAVLGVRGTTFAVKVY